MNIAFFGSSLLSAYWNGACTYYRGLLRELAALGHRITFYEPDAYERQQHRDLDRVPYARSVVYSADGEQEVLRALRDARQADVAIKASGVGVFDELLEREVAGMRSPRRRVFFWDVDAPATLARIAADGNDPFRELIPEYDVICTYGGGRPVIDRYGSFGAKRCVPVYNALDRTTHYPVPAEARYAADLAFLGNRMPDREERVGEFFFKPVSRLPRRRFLLGGSGWDARADNLTCVGHVYTGDHNAFNSSPTAVLNVSRASMAATGFSPATRLFEAAGAGACVITDAWEGIELFLEPDKECLVAQSGEDVAGIVDGLSPERARRIGRQARRRVEREHTYAQRAEQVDRILRSSDDPAGG